MKAHRITILAGLSFLLCMPLLAGPISGTFVTPLLGPVANGTLLLTLSQQANYPGSYFVAPTSVSCATSTDGSVVGVPNPEAVPTGEAFAGLGTLPAGVYFVEIAYTGVGSTATLASPEVQLSLISAGQLQINAPALQPAAATGYAVYIGISSGGETLQGTVTGFGSAYVQGTPLTAGAAAPTNNTTVCAPAFNDTLIPSYTYYTAVLSDDAGNIIPGFPQNWYLAGAAVDVSNITALASNPAVRFPMPVLQNPPTAAAQSVASPLYMNLNPIEDASNIGPGYFSAFWAGALPAAGTALANWTPNVKVELQRLDVNAQTAGAGGSAGTTVTVSDGTSTCTFAGNLPAGALTSSVQPSGLGAGCAFDAGVALTVKLSADDHLTGPQNVSWAIEMTSR